MRNGGEACTAANRFYVQRGIAGDFAAGLAERMAALTVALKPLSAQEELP